MAGHQTIEIYYFCWMLMRRDSTNICYFKKIIAICVSFLTYAHYFMRTFYSTMNGILPKCQNCAQFILVGYRSKRILIQTRTYNSNLTPSSKLKFLKGNLKTPFNRMLQNGTGWQLGRTIKPLHILFVPHSYFFRVQDNVV